MSRRYKNNSNQKIVNTILLFILFLLYPPLFGCTLLFCIIFYFVRVDYNRIAFALTSFTYVMLFIAGMLFINDFLLSQLTIIRVSLFNVIKLNFFDNMLTPLDLNNIVFCIITSIEIACYFKYFASNRSKKKKAGVHAFDDEIDEVVDDDSSYNVKGVYIGKSDKGKVNCNMSHTFVTGTTGTGKTVLLSNYIDYCAKNRLPNLIVDGKGDTDNDSILEIAKRASTKYGQKLYIINMNDAEHSALYNPFVDNETIIKDMLVNMTDWSEPHYKVNFERFLQRVIKLLLLKYNKLDFKLILNYLRKSKFEELSAELVRDNLVTKEEHINNLDLYKQCNKIVEDASARLAVLEESSIGKIFDSNGINIFDALQENAMIIFVLNPLLYPELSSLFGRLVLIDCKTAVSKLYTDKKERAFFIFDEINVYASSVFLDLLNKSRSANVTCVLAMQSLSDIEKISSSFKNQIIENCNNFVFMRQNTFTSAEECAKIIGTKEKMKMTYKIDSNEGSSGGKGSARKVREFIVHPDTIKALKLGEAVFVNKDYGFCTHIKVNMPNIVRMTRCDDETV